MTVVSSVGGETIATGGAQHPTVLVTEMFEPAHLQDLRSAFPSVRFVQLRQDGAVPPEARNAEALFRCFMSKDELRRTLGDAPGIRWLHTCTAGFDQLMVPEIQERRLVVSRSPNAFNVPMAEFVIGYILLVAKRFPALLRSQARREWEPPDPEELVGKTVGIVGTGSIGAEVARRCVGLDMRVIGTRRTPGPETPPYFEWVRGPEALPTVLAESDFVLLASPLTPETRGMIAEPQLRAMKPTAYLLNVARGALIVDNDLVRALREGWIAGACLDAFAEEPLPADHPFWGLESLVLTPHCSYRSPYGTERGIEAFKGNLRRYLAGEPLKDTLKDPELGY